MNIGIDAINIRSDGGQTHLREILKFANISSIGETKIYLWCSKENSKLIKKSTQIEIIKLPSITNSWFFGIIWQLFVISSEAKKYHCKVLLNLNGTYLGSFKNFITIPQNLLPFNLKEASRYGISFQLLKLLFLRLAHKICLNKANGIIFLSEYQKNLLSKLISSKNIKKKKLCVIPHAGQKSDRKKEFKEISEYSKKNPFVIGYVSGIEPYKNHELLLKHILEIKRLGYPIKYKIIGKTGHKKTKLNLLKLIESIDKDRDWLEWQTNVNYNSIDQIYKNLDLMIFGSTCESFGIPIAEAINSRVPSICSNKDCIKSSFGNSVIYFDPFNKVQTVEIIENLLLSRKLRKAVSVNSFNKFKDWSWQSVSKNTFDFLMKF
tara:strand:- start:13431 stop:14564 length:1134 start_codon:yes stop_codon:yes gene_type:complete